MRHGPSDLQALQRQEGTGIGLAIIARELESIARHAASIQGKMHRQSLAGLALLIKRLEPCRRVRIAYELDNAQPKAVFHFIGRGGTDAINPAAIAELASHSRLIIGGDRHITNPLCNDRGDEQGNAIAIGVGLHYGAESGRADLGANGINIGLKRGGIDLDPAIAPPSLGTGEAKIIG